MAMSRLNSIPNCNSVGNVVLCNLLLCPVTKLVANRRYFSYSLKVDFYVLAFAFVCTYVCQLLILVINIYSIINQLTLHSNGIKLLFRSNTWERMFVSVLSIFDLISFIWKSNVQGNDG